MKIGPKSLLNTIKARTLFLCYCILCAYCLIFIRLFVLQIKQYSFYESLAHDQYGALVSVMPQRAYFYDKTKTIPLAFNIEVLSAFITPHHILEKEKTAAFLEQHFKGSTVFEKTDRKFAWIKRNLSAQEIEAIKNSGLKDLYVVSEYKRYYPFPELSPLLGATNIDNKGIEGLEFAFNDWLEGKPSKMFVLRDGRKKHFHFAHTTLEKGKKGEAIALSIDQGLQRITSMQLQKMVESFEAKQGAALILDVPTGKILTMASYPFTQSSQEPLKNPIVTNCYEFGSVMKTFLALAALEEKVTSLDEMIDCEGKVTFIDRTRVENPKSTGVVSFTDAFKRSSNIAMAKISKRLGTKLYDHLIRLGFSSLSNIECPGERSGYVPHPCKWSRSTQLVLAFGYEMNATLLQLARAFAIIINDGFDIKPTILENAPKKVNTIQLYSKESCDALKSILLAPSQQKNFGSFRVGGKTGTARIVENGTYSTKRHVYSYIEFVENKNYKRVIVTFLYEPKKANLWAADVTKPCAEALAEKMIIYDLLHGNVSV